MVMKSCNVISTTVVSLTGKGILDATVATVQGEAETVWHPYGVQSLLLIFKKGRERLSLQIFRNNNRAGLRIVTASHRRHQNEKKLFWDHVRSRQNDGDRVLKSLPEGGHAAASIKVAAVNLWRGITVMKGLAKEERPRLPQSKEAVHMVRVTIDTRTAGSNNYGATTTDRQQQQNSASGPSGNPSHLDKNCTFPGRGSQRSV